MKTGRGHWEDLSGQRFGRLEAISRDTERSKEKGKSYWICHCDCGNTISTLADNLKRNTSSCGCFRRERCAILGLEPNRSRCLPNGEAAFRALYRKYKKSAREKDILFTLTEKEFRELLCAKCFYCGGVPNRTFRTGKTTGEFVYNGIDRVDNESGYIKANVVTCCTLCNWLKGTTTQEVFLRQIEKIYLYRIAKESEDYVDTEESA